MTNIRKRQPPPHVVIVDTNILWHKDKGPPVNPEFDAFWGESTALCNLELVIPEVVRGELLFQQTSSAIKAHDKIAEHLKEISSITARTHTAPLSEATIKRQVVEKFDKWARAKRATIAPAPTHLIDWKALIDAAVWRLPPFEADPKNPDLEKGFRDAVILETVSDVVQRETRKVNVVFLCSDDLLRKTAADRLHQHSRFSCYETLADFSSFLKLTNEKLTSAFIRSILDRAKDKFYSPDDPTCLYTREGIFEKIHEQFKETLENPEKSQPDYLSVLGTSLFSGPWLPRASGNLWLSNPEFVRLEGKRQYHWKTPLTFVRLFKPKEALLSLLPSVGQSPDEVLILTFAVFWKADVKLDGRFHAVTFEAVELIDRNFRLPTEEEKKKYRLEPSDG